MSNEKHTPESLRAQAAFKAIVKLASLESPKELLLFINPEATEADLKFADVALDILREYPSLTATVASQSSELSKLREERDEKEVMIAAFDKISKMFEGRRWLTEGRGLYTYDDERYKLEVRYLLDEFNALKNDLWANIKTKTADYKRALISESLTEKEAEIERLNKKYDETVWNLKQDFDTLGKQLRETIAAKDKELASLRHQIIQDSKDVRTLREDNRELVGLLTKAERWLPAHINEIMPTLFADIRAALSKSQNT